MQEMQEFLAGVVVTLLFVYVSQVWAHMRIDKKRRRVDALYEAMLTATWDVQDAANLNWYFPTEELTVLENRLKEMRELKLERNTAARRYFAAVGE